VPFRIGSRWASDFRFVTRHESWFWHLHGRRVYNAQWGWDLMNPDSGWRAYWARRVLYEASLLGDDGEVAGPAERYLAYLAAIERSPNTVRAYAVSLKLWFEFLQHAAVNWDEAGAEDVARFVGWLRAPAGNVIVLADGNGARRPATVNRYLAGVFGFYDHHARTGVQVAAGLVSWRRISRGSYKPFLHHVTKGRPIPVRPVKLHVPRQAPRTLGPGQIVAILGACEHLRDRFLLSLLAETGMRVGQALGLHHCDFVSREREVHIVPRADNANGARAKVRRLLADPAVRTVVVEHRDRLGRMNVELVEAALSAIGRTLVVLDPADVDDGLVRDMTEVLTSFCARLYGRRSARNRAEKALRCAASDVGPMALAQEQS